MFAITSLTLRYSKINADKLDYHMQILTKFFPGVPTHRLLCTSPKGCLLKKLSCLVSQAKHLKIEIIVVHVKACMYVASHC